MIQLENHVFGHTEFNLNTEDVFGVAGKILVKEKIHRQNYSGTLLAHQACSTYEILIEVNEQYYDSYTVYIGDCFSNPQNGDYVIPIIGGGYLEIPHHGSGGGGGGTPAAPYLSTHAEKMDHLMTILDLNMDSPEFLAGDMVLVSEVYDFVYNNPDASSLQDISMHVNRIVSDLNYADFISDYRNSSGGTLFPWWKNEDWLDEPDNFNFDIENLSQNYDRLNRAEKALISLFPFQAYTIAKNKAHAEAISQATNLPNPLNGKQDAFRHAFFQAINTRDVPPKFLDGKVYTASEIVSLFAMAHESEVPDVLSLERDMDIFNNNKGIAAGATATNHSNQMVANTIMQLLVIGELKYISPLDFVASEKFDKDRDGVQDCSTCLNGILPNSILVPTNQ